MEGLEICPVHWDSITNGVSTPKDIRVYLMWSGTDSRGKILNSVGKLNLFSETNNQIRKIHLQATILHLTKYTDTFYHLFNFRSLSLMIAS